MTDEIRKQIDGLKRWKVDKGHWPEINKDGPFVEYSDVIELIEKLTNNILSSQMYQAGLIEGKRQAEDFAKHVYVSLTDYINDDGDLKTFAELKKEHEQFKNYGK